jgi:hypothetical protein
MRKGWIQGSAIAVLSSTCLFAEAPARVQTFPLRDTTGLVAPKVKAEAVKYLGRECVRITMDGEDHEGVALLPGTDFQDGVIEADIALKARVPPGVRYPGFVGIAFRARPDASHYDLFYLRPGNSSSADQAQRNHSVQYSAEPDFGWYRLRREWPSIYESHADLAFETWTKVKIEVAGRAAKLYLNGSDVAGSWEMRYGSDAGRMDATMQLRRQGDKVTGTWSGPLGEGRAIIGTWRAGYVELSFAGEWPKDSRQGAPGPVNAFLAGWIDGDSGKGRMRVEGRSDGAWVAKRKE